MTEVVSSNSVEVVVEKSDALEKKTIKEKALAIVRKVIVIVLFLAGAVGLVYLGITKKPLGFVALGFWVLAFGSFLVKDEGPTELVPQLVAVNIGITAMMVYFCFA